MRLLPSDLTADSNSSRFALLALALGFSLASAAWVRSQDAAGDPAEGLPPALVEDAPDAGSVEKVVGGGAKAPAKTSEPRPASHGDSQLPQPVNAEHFSAIRSQSPFLRTLNISETYSLRGVAEIGGDPVATLYNRKTRKTLLVTKDKANEAGIQMVEVVPAKDLGGVAVKVSFAGEVVELKYDNSVVTPKPKSGGSSRPSGEPERRGPSKEDMARYNSLTEEQKQKFRDYARQTMTKHPNMSREERSNMIRGAMTRLAEGRDIQLDSQPSSGSSTQQRPSSSGGDRR